MKKILSLLSAAVLLLLIIPFAGCSGGDETVTLRVSNWEEYIDLGGWSEDEVIDLESGDIFGENSMIDDFTERFNATHDYNVKVEYSTFGTNEDLYNRLSLGDTYDLVCPSDYMIMKLLAEDKIEKYSEEFLNGEGGYAENVSPYIAGVFEDYGWTEYAACYMWGTSGFVYDPENLKDESDVSSCKILINPDYKRAVTIKDNVRDAYFAALSIIKEESLLSGGLTDGKLSEYLNDTNSETIAKAEDVLKQIKENVYSFETDSGKSDMVTGKVAANYQWSGDAVYIMDEADAEDSDLWYSVPNECSNLWFDGWVMLKDGIDGSQKKKEAAEAFVDFLSESENAIRNMYYIGYTSSIATDTVFEYMEWNYGAEGEDTLDYDLSYFFGGDCAVTADKENFVLDENGINRGRQLFAQYPPSNVIGRSVVMLDFGDKLSEINQMWINVRCPDLKDVDPALWWTLGALALAVGAGICLYVFRYRLPSYRPKKGFEKVEK